MHARILKEKPGRKQRVGQGRHGRQQGTESRIANSISRGTVRTPQASVPVSPAASPNLSLVARCAVGLGFFLIAQIFPRPCFFFGKSMRPVAYVSGEPRIRSRQQLSRIVQQYSRALPRMEMPTPACISTTLLSRCVSFILGVQVLVSTHGISCGSLKRTMLWYVSLFECFREIIFTIIIHSISKALLASAQKERAEAPIRHPLVSCRALTHK